MKINLLRSVAVAIALVSLQSISSLAQETPGGFWLAGRYDRNRVVVYFDVVKSGDTIPPDALKIAPPVTDAFFTPVALPAGYIARFQRGPAAKRFALGDRYDLLLGNGEVATVTLTTLVGFEGDEGVGNDSFIGALGTLDHDGGLAFEKDYYAVRSLRKSANDGPKVKLGPSAGHAGLTSEPVRFDIQAQAVSLLVGRMKKIAAAPARFNTNKADPSVSMQSFTVADGSLRYYVRAEWETGEGRDESTYALAAWMAPKPALHILAVENQSSMYGFENETPNLRSVIDLGGRENRNYRLDHG